MEIAVQTKIQTTHYSSLELNKISNELTITPFRTDMMKLLVSKATQVYTLDANLSFQAAFYNFLKTT